MSATTTPRPRTFIYVDGFNLYYGAIRGGPNKWLDLQRYFRMLRPHDDIQAIRYFSAPISGPNLANQEAYLRALETLPLVQVVLGRFKSKQVKCNNTLCTHTGSRVFQTQEEKRTDVNIALAMLDDAYQGLCERMILVSGDSDLVPAIDLVKQRFPGVEVLVYVPARHKVRGAAVELRSAADHDRILPLNFLPLAQFPANIPDGAGSVISKPASW